MTQQNLLDLAKQGNAQAIDVLLNRVFQLNGITARTTIKDGYLHLLLESTQIPNQQTLVPAIHGAIGQLGLPTVHSLMIYGRQTGTEQPAWTQIVPLRHQADLLPLTPMGLEISPGTPASPSLTGASHGSPTTNPTETAVTPGFDQLPLQATSFTNGSPSPAVNGNAVGSDASFYTHSTDPAIPEVLPEEELIPVEPHLVLSAEPEPVAVTGVPRRRSNRTNLVFLRNILLACLGVMVLGILWLHNSVVAKQKATIDQAQRLAASAGTASNAKSLAALKSSEQQLQEAVNLLESVPNVPASAQQQAEQELGKVKAQLTDVQKKLDVEKQAQTDLQSAEQLVATATGLLQQPGRSPATSQQAEAKLQEAIRLLKAVPANTFVSAQAKQKLKMYQADYTTLKEQSEQRKPTAGSKSRSAEKRK